MKAVKFQFAVSIKTSAGYVETGRFFVGNRLRNAITILEMLEGSNKGGIDPILKLDLIKNTHDEDSVLETLDCTLEQISENVKIITRELFKFANMEGKNP